MLYKICELQDVNFSVLCLPVSHLSDSQSVWLLLMFLVTVVVVNLVSLVVANLVSWWLLLMFLVTRGCC